MNNREIVDQYLHHMEHTRGRSKATVKAYGSLLGMWIDTLGSTGVLDASRGQMERFIARPRLRRGAGTTGSAASRKRDADILRAFYRWAHEEGLTDSFLAIALHGPTVRNTNPRPIPDEVWIPLWTSPLEPADRVMLGLGFYCGLRRAELASLRPSQVRDGYLVDFIRKGGGEHTLDIHAVLGIFEHRLGWLARNQQLEAFTSNLEELSASKERYLLPFNGNGDTLAKRLVTIQRRSGSELFTAHQMRHSCATNLLRAGVPMHLVREILNHTSIEVTQRYVKAGGQELRDWWGEQG